MAKHICEFERLKEWEEIAKKLIDKYPERFSHIDSSKLVAYLVINKKQTKNVRPYEMQVDNLPMRLTNSYDYFIWFKHPDDWNDKTKNIQVALVFSALERIDPDKPFNILPLDYRDQSMMVKTFGIEWYFNANIPNILKEDVKFRE